MLAEKIRQLTAEGYEVKFFEVTGYDAHGEGVPREPYMTLEVTKVDTGETVGADFSEGDPSESDIMDELEGLPVLLEAKAKARLATVASDGGDDAA